MGVDGVYRLKKALFVRYGLKQAPKVWYQKLKGVMRQLGFKPSWADQGLFITASAGSSGEMPVILPASQGAAGLCSSNTAIWSIPVLARISA